MNQIPSFLVSVEFQGLHDMPRLVPLMNVLFGGHICSMETFQNSVDYKVKLSDKSICNERDMLQRMTITHPYTLSWPTCAFYMFNCLLKKYHVSGFRFPNIVRYFYFTLIHFLHVDIFLIYLSEIHLQMALSADC